MNETLIKVINEFKNAGKSEEYILTTIGEVYGISATQEAIGVVFSNNIKKNVLGDLNKLTDIYSDKVVRSKDSSFNIYMKYLYTKWNQSSVLRMSDSVNEIAQYLGNPESETPFINKGLVFGQVQSGKTAHYIGLSHKARDLGYKLIIFITSNDNLLRKQTQQRIDTDLMGYKKILGKMEYNEKNKSSLGKIEGHNLLFHSLTTTESDDVGGEFRHNKTNYIVIKKHSTVLKSWISRIKEVANNTDQSILVIDDEADWGSVNTADENENPKTINQLMRDILEIKRVSYIAYTATPFANLLVKDDDENTVDIYPSKFIACISPGEGYKGYNEYFLSDDDVIDFNYINGLSYKDDDELLSNPIIISALEEAIRKYNINIFYSIFSTDEIRNEISTDMLINISRLTDVQNSLSKIVNEIVEDISEEVKNEGAVYWYKIFSEIYSNFQFDTFSTKWNKFIKHYDAFKPKAIPVNSTRFSKDELQKVSNKRNTNAFSLNNNYIFVGGNKLSRGLTIENLTNVFFIRNTSQYDSALQMARWFGYHTSNRNNKIVIHTSDDVISSFIDISKSTLELEDTIQSFVNEGKSMSDFRTTIRKVHKINPTSWNKMRNAISNIIALSWSGKTVSELNYYDYDHAKRTAYIERITQDLNFDKMGNYYISKNIDNKVALYDMLDNIEIPHLDLIKKEINDREVNIVFRTLKENLNGSININGYNLNYATRKTSIDSESGFKLKSLHTQSDTRFRDEIYKLNNNGNFVNVIFYPFVKKINEVNKEFIGTILSFGPAGNKDNIIYWEKKPA